MKLKKLTLNKETISVLRTQTDQIAGGVVNLPYDDPSNAEMGICLSGSGNVGGGPNTVSSCLTMPCDTQDYVSCGCGIAF